MNRREILRLGSLSLLGVTLPELLAANAAPRPVGDPSFGRAKACIFLFMWGGPSQLDTWDLKPNAPLEFRGEFRPISTRVPGIHISEHFPRLADRTNDLCIVRSMTHTDVNHLTATHWLLTGHRPVPAGDRRAEWPHLGSVLARIGRGRGPLPPSVSMRPKLDNDVPRFVEQSQGQWAGWLGPQYDPLIIDALPGGDNWGMGELQIQPELPLKRLSQRRELLRRLDGHLPASGPALEAKDAHVQRAFDLLLSRTAGRGVFDLDQEPTAVRQRYGLNPHGQSVLQARRLVERGVPLVTVFWPNDGVKNVSVYWDTHNRNFADHRDRLMPVADQAFSALLDDLDARGMLDETLIVWSGEFGRTPRVGQRSSDAGAGGDGRDHWPGCFTTVLAGGGFQRGCVFGRSDKHAAYPDEDPVSPADLVTTVYHALGVPRTLTLPDTAGRPQVMRAGNVIRQLLA